MKHPDKVIPPSSQEAEREVLSAALVDPRIWPTVESSVEAGDFYNLKGRELFEVLQATHDRHGTIALALVMQAYKDRGVWKQSTTAWLADILERSGTTNNVGHYCEILRSKSLARRVLDASWSLQATACDDALTDSSRLSAVDDVLRGLYKAGRVEDLVTAGQAVLQHAEAVQEAIDSDGGIMGLRTGIPTVDQATGGLKGGWQVVILADSGVGKSTLALQIANLAARDNKRVAVFSLEMSAQEVVGRAICQASGVAYQRQTRGTMRPDEMARYQDALGVVGNWPIHIDENEITLGRMAIRAKALAHQHGGLDLVILDYLQLLTIGDGGKRNRTEEIETITRRMKRLARELDCVVLTLSQPTSEGGRRGRIDHRDAKGAQSIGADVDLALCISRTQDDGRRLDGTKFRHGPTFYVPEDRLVFLGDRMVFVERQR